VSRVFVSEDGTGPRNAIFLDIDLPPKNWGQVNWAEVVSF